MATNLALSNNADEDYIDMELSSSSSNFFCCSTNSPPQSREFEFQMSSSLSKEIQPTTTPADELFYKGKLLPLRLPPHLQMVQKLLQTTDSITSSSSFEEENCSSTHIPSTNNSTPMESCNISPAESFRVSGELNPDEYFFEWYTEPSGFISAAENNNQKNNKSWFNRLKLVKHSSLCQRLKDSRSYLMSLFSKSGSFDESCAKAAKNGVDECGHVSQGKDCSTNNNYLKAAKKNPFVEFRKGSCPILADVIKSIDKEGFDDNHRRSFSGAIKRHSPVKCLSSSSSSSENGSSSSSSSCSSFSFNSQGFYEVQLLKRSSSVTTEKDGLIEAAIAHCKKAQEHFTIK